MTFNQMCRILIRDKSTRAVNDLPMYFKSGQTYYPLLKVEIGKLGLTDMDAVLFSTDPKDVSDATPQNF